MYIYNLDFRTGLYISTKSPRLFVQNLKDERLDITQEYKFPEGNLSTFLDVKSYIIKTITNTVLGLFDYYGEQHMYISTNKCHIKFTINCIRLNDHTVINLLETVDRLVCSLAEEPDTHRYVFYPKITADAMR